MEDRNAFGELTDLPIFVGTVLFAIPIPMVSCVSILFRIPTYSFAFSTDVPIRRQYEKSGKIY